MSNKMKMKDMSVGELINHFLLNMEDPGEHSPLLQSTIEHETMGEALESIGLDSETFCEWVRKNLNAPNSVMATVYKLVFEGTRMRMLCSYMTSEAPNNEPAKILKEWDNMLGEEFGFHDARMLMAKLDLAAMEAAKIDRSQSSN